MKKQPGVNFTGTAKEYFGIWIVNLVLSMITLGVYSAWAKVRRETYFKNNTKIGTNGFGYHATGGQILKGRLIVVGVLIVLNIISSFQPIIGFALLPFFLFLTPWLLNKSMKFSARMTSYRNVRFNWYGTYWKTFWFLVIAPFFGFLTLGLITPLITKSYYSYFARSHSFGKSKFSCHPKTRTFYFAFFIGFILPTIIISCIFGILLFTVKLFVGGYNSLISLQSFLPMFIIILIFLTTSIYRVLCRNLMMKSLILENAADFDSNLNPIRFIWISISNLVAIILSFSLLLPWAKIRMYNYIVSCTKINIHGDLDKIVDEANSVKSAFGEELAESQDIEVPI